jgi:hypothetical protein
MEKLDLKKVWKPLFNQHANKISYIDVPEFGYLAVDGSGHPENNPVFQEKTGALYSVAYTLKFMLKDAGMNVPDYTDYVIPPLEGFWFMNDCNGFDASRTEDWRWTLMIMQPDFITQELIGKAKEEISRKGKQTNSINDVRLERIADGKAVQILHTGSYNTVGESVKKLLDELERNNLRPARKYREIYLSDPRKTAPEKLKTICRMPYEGK